MKKVYNLKFMELLETINDYDLGTVVESEKGDFYKLTSIYCTKEERKFARMKDKGTTLRFMTYDNLRKKFRIVEDEEIDIQEIEELDPSKFYFRDGTDLIYKLMYDKINENIRVVNKMQKEIKELQKDDEEDMNLKLDKAFHNHYYEEEEK